VNDSANAWTRTANTTFTTTGDRTVVFSKGTRLRVTDTTTKYFVVVSSSFGAGVTTVTITGGIDYVLAANPSAQSYSYAVNPQGYPGYFNHTTTFGGFSADPSAVSFVFSVLGSLCNCYLFLTPGTSNATTFTISLPIAVLQGGYSQSLRVHNNGANGVTAGMIEFVGSSVTANLYRDGAFLAWTASGAKGAWFESLVYQF